MRGTIKNIVSVIVILLMANSLIHIGSNDIKNGIDKVGAYILCSIIGAILICLCRRLFKEIEAQKTYSKKVLVGGTLLICVIMNHIMPMKYVAYSDRTSIISIEATGQKNELSLGTEVWIKSIQVDGKNIDLESLVNEGKWEYKNGKLVSYKNQPQQFIESFTYKDRLSIELVQHPYSGEANISIDGDVSLIDLYSEIENTKLVEVEAKLEPIVGKTVITHIGYFLLSIIISAMIIQTYFLMLKSNPQLAVIGVISFCVILEIIFWIGLTHSIVLNILICLGINLILLKYASKFMDNRDKLS